jgi:hypothetical protein
VLRTTFRLHDNPALQCALRNTTHPLRRVVIPILSDHVSNPESAVPTISASAGTGHIEAPRFVAWTQSKKHHWGYHQFLFLLHAIRTFVLALRSSFSKSRCPVIEVVSGTAHALVRNILHNENHNAEHKSGCVVVDVCEDTPMWGCMDKQLAMYTADVGVELCPVVTNTLLDWRPGAPESAPHHEFLSSWGKTKNNKKLRQYVAEQLRDTRRLSQQVRAQSHPSSKPQQLSYATLVLSTQQPPPAASAKASRTRKLPACGGRCRSKSVGRIPTLVTVVSLSHAGVGVRKTPIETHIRQWESVMCKRGVAPFSPPGTISCEEWALQQLRTCSAPMACAAWEKPKSASALSIREYAVDPLKNTSKLSPFLALGVLSPRVAYLAWGGASCADKKANASRPSSALAQLLWRETFHASSYLEGFWDTRSEASWDTSSPPRFWRRDLDWEITQGDDPKLEPFLHANTGYADLDEALRVLVRDGWVHHLRRHIIADFLTRGKLKCDWMVGESWFRHTLVDHDACLNRCNWLWLSACEFSAAQLVRHYGWGTYVKRQSAGTKLLAENHL